MNDDEKGIIRTVKDYRSLITDMVIQYQGCVVDSPGDNILADFASVVDTVECAVEVQQELHKKYTELHR